MICTPVPRRGSFAVTSVVFVLLAACGETPQAVPPAPEVGFVTVQAQPVPITTELAGRLRAQTVSEVRPQVNGVIRRRLFEEGAYVRAGQPLYEIDSRLYQASRNEAAAQLESARAQLASAEARAARYEGLTELDAVAGQDIDDARATARQARASVAQAQAALRTADINLGFTRVTAPISGRIGRSNFTQGALVTAAQADALATIQALDPMFVDITESSARILEIRKALSSGGLTPASASVTLILEDGTEYPQPATIAFTEPVVDQATGAVTIRARVPNAEGLLLPGMFVRVRLEEGVAPNALLVPQQGVSRAAGGQASVMVVTADNKVEQRNVTADRAIGDQWLVTEGLRAGDRVIVEGTGKVRAGATVRAVQANLKRG